MKADAGVKGAAPVHVLDERAKRGSYGIGYFEAKVERRIDVIPAFAERSITACFRGRQPVTSIESSRRIACRHRWESFGALASIISSARRFFFPIAADVARLREFLFVDSRPIDARRVLTHRSNRLALAPSTIRADPQGPVSARAGGKIERE